MVSTTLDKKRLDLKERLVTAPLPSTGRGWGWGEEAGGSVRFKHVHLPSPAWQSTVSDRRQPALGVTPTPNPRKGEGDSRGGLMMSMRMG